MIELAHPNYQTAVREWVVAAFGKEVANEVQTRCWRFFEEAGELCQSLGMTKEDALRLVEYTWGRPKGEPRQEMGGVMVTLAALAAATDLDIDEDGWVELARCWENIEKIRAKQQAKKLIGLGGPEPGPAVLDIQVKLGMAIKIGTEWYPQGLVLHNVRDVGREYIVDVPSASGLVCDVVIPKSRCIVKEATHD